MKHHPLKVHYVRAAVDSAGICGLPGRLTASLDAVTCRVCKFRYLESMAPWARDFLLDLRAAHPDARTSERSTIAPLRLSWEETPLKAS